MGKCVSKMKKPNLDNPPYGTRDEEVEKGEKQTEGDGTRDEVPVNGQKDEVPVNGNATTNEDEAQDEDQDEVVVNEKLLIEGETSSSVRFRKEGNAVYVTATTKLKPSLQKERLKQALNLYNKAYNSSENPDEQVSAAKNLGMVSWRLGKASDQSYDNPSIVVHFYKEAYKYMTEAWLKSADVKTNIWRDDICSSTLSCWENFRNGRLSAIALAKRIIVLYDVLQKIEIPTVRAECYIQIATCHFHVGVTAIQNKDFKVALYQMGECYMPINEATVCGRDISLPHIISEAETLENDVLMQQCIAESMQANQIGDELFEKLIKDEENLNMDMVYEILDWHKQAVVRTRGITEVETEAIALSRIGKVYDKVLKLKVKAKECLMRSMQLANSMHPRIFHGEDWFEECKEILERYQKEIVQQEDEKWQKERETYVKELKTELEDLKQNDTKHTYSRSEGFLKYVYEKYPPSNPDHKLEGIPSEGEMEAKALKKVLQKAIVHYHPDRIDADKYGKKRKVLSEEITKFLTRRYESFKL